MSTSEVSASSRAIHDVLIRSLEVDGSKIRLYRFTDHLLPRIGLIEQIKLKPDQDTGLRTRSNCDEIWFLLSGAGSFVWQDNRENSPSNGFIQRFAADKPTLLFAPFGVAFGVRAEKACHLIRVAAHDESEDGGGQILPWPE